MLPTKWGEMGEQVVRNILDLAQGGDGPLEIPRVPEDDRGDDEVQAGGAVLLVLGKRCSLTTLSWGNEQARIASREGGEVA